MHHTTAGFKTANLGKIERGVRHSLQIFTGALVKLRLYLLPLYGTLFATFLTL